MRTALSAPLPMTLDPEHAGQAGAMCGSICRCEREQPSRSVVSASEGLHSPPGQRVVGASCGRTAWHRAGGGHNAVQRGVTTGQRPSRRVPHARPNAWSRLADCSSAPCRSGVTIRMLLMPLQVSHCPESQPYHTVSSRSRRTARQRPLACVVVACGKVAPFAYGVDHCSGALQSCVLHTRA